MKKILGYTIKFSGDSWGDALYNLYDHDLYKTKEQALDDIEDLKRIDCIPKRSKPKVFRVVVEEV